MEEVVFPSQLFTLTTATHLIMAVDPRSAMAAPSVSSPVKQGKSCAVEDEEECPESTFGSSWSSIQTQQHSTTNSSSIDRRSNLTLLLKRRRKEAKEHGKKAEDQENQTKPSDQRHKHNPPLQVMCNQPDKPTRTMTITERPDDFRFLTEVYRLDKQKPSEEEDRFWQSQFNQLCVW